MWESFIDDVFLQGTACISARLKVPGGWIVRTIISRYQSGVGVEQTFIKDSGHEWELPKQDDEA